MTHITKESDDLPATTAVVPIIRVEKNDNFATFRCFVCDADGRSMDIILYNPETGVATYSPRV